MEHERMRFKTMTIKQLFTRLDKITHVDKLQKFIQVAGEYKYFGLQTYAIARLTEITNEMKYPLLVTRNKSKPTKQPSQKMPKPSIKQTKTDKPRDVAIPLKRHLEF